MHGIAGQNQRRLFGQANRSAGLEYERNAMTDKAAIHADFEDVKRVKTRKVWQLIFEVPEERYDAAIEALGGSPQSGASRPVAIALLKPESVSETTAEQTRPKGGPICKRAVLLCKNPEFRLWWMGFSGLRNDAERLTKERMYQVFGITSRAELDHNEEAADNFEQIERNFYDSQQGRSDEDLKTQARL